MKRCAFIVTIVLLAAACSNGDYEIPLPHGYFVARVSAGEFGLVGPDRRTVVVWRLSRYAVHGDIVFGETPPLDGRDAGYFIVNTATGEVRTDLSENVWSDALTKLHIAERSIRVPSRFGVPRSGR